MCANVPRIGEVAGNRSGKFRFRRHVANAFLSVAKLQKKPMQKALAAYEDETFNLPKAPPFCQCDVSGSFILRLVAFRQISFLMEKSRSLHDGLWSSPSFSVFGYSVSAILFQSLSALQCQWRVNSDCLL
jgi:hypothetical protein